MRKFLSRLFGPKDAAATSAAVTRFPERARENKGRREPPADVNFAGLEYVPLPPCPRTWEVDGREEFHQEYSDPVLGPVIQAGYKQQHTKVIKLSQDLSAEQRQGAAGETISKAYRAIIIKRRKAGQLASAAKHCVEMLEAVPSFVDERDERRFNKILDEMDKKGVKHKYQPVAVVKASAQPRFQVSSDAGWAIVAETKLSAEEKPDTAFRDVVFTPDGVLLLDGSGRSAAAAGGPAALRKLDEYGHLVAERPLTHDIYRTGGGPLSRNRAIFDSGGGLHIYDAALNVAAETDLRNDPRVLDHFRTVDTNYWGDFKSQVRAVDASPDGARYLFTLADEAWCCTLDGRTCWGLRMPLNEGFERVVGRTGHVGVAAEVDQALRALGLSLPISPTEIKKRYWQLALQHHPDRNPNDPHAGRRMQELNEAFSMVTGVDPNSLAYDESDVTYFRRTGPDHVIDAGAFQVEITVGGHAQDWVYGASFGAMGGGAYLATYSGKVVQVTSEGVPVRVYDLGSTLMEIVDTGQFLYLLTPTRLYVLQDGTNLINFLDVHAQGRLVVTSGGFGLMAEKCLQWFSPNGTKLGEITTRDPIRLVYASHDGAVIETRQHRAVVGGLTLDKPRSSM